MQQRFGKDTDFTTLEMFNFFVQRCKENLHIGNMKSVLNFDIDFDVFSDRIFPYW